jgi:hypothetical protein
VLYHETNLNPAITTHGNLRRFPPGYAVVGFTLHPGYKSEEKHLQWISPTRTCINLRGRDKTRINMKHSDTYHTDIGSAKSPQVMQQKIQLKNSRETSSSVIDIDVDPRL